MTKPTPAVHLTPDSLAPRSPLRTWRHIAIVALISAFAAPLALQAAEQQPDKGASDKARPAKDANAKSPPARTVVPPPEKREQIANKARKPGANGAPVDYSGQHKSGKASYYGPSFHGKKMANGERMNPQASEAASKTLPLGSQVEVKNLENGRTAQVEITDRGPYVKDRIVDVTPKVADQLDLKRDGVAPVEVKPLVVPQPDGTLKQLAPTR